MTTATVTPEANDVLDAGIAKALRLIELMAWADALACCNDILAIAPMHAKAHHLASYAAGRLAANDAGMYDLALSHAQMAVQIDPYQPLYRYNLAVDLNLRGRENEAAIHYQVCLRQEPDHQNALWSTRLISLNSLVLQNSPQARFGYSLSNFTGVSESMNSRNRMM